MQNANDTKYFDGNSYPTLIIAGPTASGKSRLALSLADRFGGEIVNADSMQIYRELPILTGRPSLEDEVRVPHHLYGIQSVAHASSAGAWLKAAVTAIKEIRSRDKLPIVCGGTGMYLKVLCEGIAPVPNIPEDAVLAARDLYEEEGGKAFRARLRRLDPISADRLPDADSQRLIRAYVVRNCTGRTLDDWKARQFHSKSIEGLTFVINILPPREALYPRIDKRLLAMVEAGVLDEVGCLDPDLNPDLPGLKALGVKEFKNYLDGQCSLDEAIRKVQQLTRNFAKRQITWFRNQLVANILVHDFGDRSENVVIQEFCANFARETR